MKSNLYFQIVSLPDREKLAAEVWLEETQIAEINQESNETEILIFLSDKNIRIPLNEFLIVLKQAQIELNK